jgi:hypothetical protein
MSGIDRKAAAAAFKERKAVGGVYAVRCTATGEAWVGITPDLQAAEKRLAFTLKLASTPHRSLAAAAKAHGAEAFAFEALEAVEEKDASPERLRKRMMARQEHHAAALRATRI